VTAGLRFAPGDTLSPVSANQTLGGSGGELAKFAVWADRAFIRGWLKSETWSGSAVIGRFENLFFSTDMLWAESLNFDGLALEGRKQLSPKLSLFGTTGAFPLHVTAFAYPVERTAKLPSLNKWLFAGQVGADWRFEQGTLLRLGVAFYDFYKVEGRLSSPCDTNVKTITCDTDDTRPIFAQKGNSYLALRTPSAGALAAEQFGAAPRYEYFGLATPFRELAVTGRVDAPISGALKAALDVETVWNLGFDRGRLEALALNNRNSCSTTSCVDFGGGPFGVEAKVTVSAPRPEVRGAWSAYVGYRRIESDAAVDAFVDPDFGLGGTNLKGAFVGTTFAPLDRVTLWLRWYSADSIAGPPYRADLAQLDLIARF
jgi:hypothetical protein